MIRRAPEAGRAYSQGLAAEAEAAALAGRLRAFLGAGVAGGDVADLRRLGHRWQAQTYRFSLIGGRCHGDWILRLYEGPRAVQRCARETAWVTGLADLGFPVPGVLTHCLDPKVLGLPFQIVHLIAGHTLDEELAQCQGTSLQRCVERFVALQVQLHRLPVGSISPNDMPSEHCRADRQHQALLSQARRLILDTHRLVEFTPVLAWIERAFEDIRWGDAVIAHNDFHPGNIVCGPDGVDRVIDWATVSASDHRYDLGWTLMLTAAYHGHRAYEAVFDAYRHAWGQPIASIDVFVLVAAVRRLLLRGLPAHAAAGTMGLPGPRLINDRHEAEHLRSVCALIAQISGLRLPGVERLLHGLR